MTDSCDDTPSLSGALSPRRPVFSTSLPEVSRWAAVLRIRSVLDITIIKEADMNMRRLIAGLGTTLSVVTTAACSASAPADRAGGDTVTLKLGTIDHVNPDGQSFGVQAFVDNIP